MATAMLTCQTNNMTFVLSEDSIHITKWNGNNPEQEIKCDFDELKKAVDNLEGRRNES